MRFRRTVMAVAVLGALVVADSGAAGAVVRPRPLAPLPISTPGLHPALVVKVDNHSAARPVQQGLNQADVLIEEYVEGISRWAAVFYSSDPPTVGPIRSARTTDLDLLAALNRPLLAWSGANRATTRLVQAADVVDVGAMSSAGRAYSRSKKRRMPHNLYASTEKLRALGGAGTPRLAPELFARGTTTQTGTTFQWVRVTMGGTRSEWRWDAASGRFRRWQNGTPHVDAAGRQIAPQSVVTLFVPYARGRADARSPEAQTVGWGAGWVLVNGQKLDVVWSRPAAVFPFHLQDASGADVLLPPGQVVLQLAPVGSAQIR